MTHPDIPLGHTIPAHRAFGWCAHCPDRTVAEELAAWQTREPIDVSPGPAADIDRLRTENERMRHELEVMYGGAFDSLSSAEPAAAPAVVEPPADQTPRRDRIRRVLCERDGQGALWGTDMLEPDEYGADADAVLAVLPEPTDRATVLNAAALHLYTALFPAVYDDMGQDAAEGVNRAVSELRRMADETATTETQPARCVCGHPIGLHHEDVCLRTDCGCADALEINAVPEALEAVLTERYTELGNSFSRMRRQEQGPDGWPAERPVGPHHVAETLRELLRRAATDGPGLRLPDHTVNEEETPPPAPRDRHRAAWNALTPQQQAAYLAQLHSAGARQDGATQ